MLQETVVLEASQGVRAAATPVSALPASRWSGRIPGLDGVRALSFIIVFVSHMGFMGARPGGFAVSVFFLLSGYLITSLLLREHYKTGTISLRAFYIRRTLRIFPSMYAVLIICALLVHWHVLKGPLNASAAAFEAVIARESAADVAADIESGPIVDRFGRGIDRSLGVGMRRQISRERRRCGFQHDHRGRECWIGWIGFVRWRRFGVSAFAVFGGFCCERW